MRAVEQTDLYINGGFFAFRREVFEYIRPGEDLVAEPFTRLIEKRLLATSRAHLRPSPRNARALGQRRQAAQRVGLGRPSRG